MNDKEERTELPPSRVVISAEAASAVAPHELVPWLMATGERFFIPYYGSRALAERGLAESLDRPDSVFWRGHCRVLLHADNGPIGGYFLLTGAELKSARSADAMTNFRTLDKEGRVRYNKFLCAIRELSAPVPDDGMFLAAIGLIDRFRGQGLGRRLLNACVREARRPGIRCLQLDVEADNTAAVRLYKSAGFTEVSSVSVPDYDLSLRSLRLDLGA